MYMYYKTNTVSVVLNNSNKEVINKTLKKLLCSILPESHLLVYSELG